LIRLRRKVKQGNVLLSQNHQKATAARGVEFEYTRAREYHIGPLDVIVTTGSASGLRTSPLSLFVGKTTAISAGRNRLRCR
jgi:hypothetical protein